MEDGLNFVLGNLRRWFSVCNLILTQDEIRKMTSIFFQMEDDLNFFQMEDNLNFLQIEDNLNILF